MSLRTSIFSIKEKYKYKIKAFKLKCFNSESALEYLRRYWDCARKTPMCSPGWGWAGERVRGNRNPWIGVSNVLKIHRFMLVLEEKERLWALWRVLGNQLVLKIGR